MSPQPDLPADVMPTMVKWLSALTLGLVGVIWRAMEARMKSHDHRLHEIAREKADAKELDRQRDNVAQIFREIAHVKDDLNDRCTQITNDVNAKHADLTRTIHTLHHETLRVIRESVSDRRAQPRDAT